MDMLLDTPLTIKIMAGVTVKVPAPPAFLLHKLLISTRRSADHKRDPWRRGSWRACGSFWSPTILLGEAAATTGCVTIMRMAARHAAVLVDILVLAICLPARAQALGTELVWCVDKQKKRRSYVLERRGTRLVQYRPIPGIFIAHGGDVYLVANEKVESNRYRVQRCWKGGQRRPLVCQDGQRARSTCACEYVIKIPVTYLYNANDNRRTLLTQHIGKVYKVEHGDSAMCTWHSRSVLQPRGSLGPMLFFVDYSSINHCRPKGRRCAQMHALGPCCYGSKVVDLSGAKPRFYTCSADDPKAKIDALLTKAEFKALYSSKELRQLIVNHCMDPIRNDGKRPPSRFCEVLSYGGDLTHLRSLFFKDGSVGFLYQLSNNVAGGFSDQRWNRYTQSAHVRTRGLPRFVKQYAPPRGSNSYLKKFARTCKYMGYSATSRPAKQVYRLMLTARRAHLKSVFKLRAKQRRARRKHARCTAAENNPGSRPNSGRLTAGNLHRAGSLRL